MEKKIIYPYERMARLVEIAQAQIHLPNSNYKHFAFIMKGRKILSIGWNDTHGTPSIINKKPYIYPLGGTHAEASAIANLDDLNICRKAYIVNIRLNKGGALRNSKPCNSCLRLLKTVGFHRVYYSTDISFDLLRL